MPATVVLVHGGWHGAWCWELVVPRLEAAGIRAAAVDLPFTGLAGDTAAVREVLDSLDDPVVLCGHSYGGAVVTGAGEHPSVRHLVYMAAFMLDENESLFTLGADVDGSELPGAMRVTDDGLCTIDPARARDVFYHDCSADLAERATNRLRPWPLESAAHPAEAVAWRSRPATYVVSEDDRAVPPRVQKAMAARAAHTISWPTSHSPFFSQPGAAAELLIGLARSVDG